MSMRGIHGPVRPSDTHVFRPRFSSQWTTGEVLAKRGGSWLVHYRMPGYDLLTSTQWFPRRRRAERSS